MESSDPRMLRERAKELECMYAVDEVLQNQRLTLPEAMRALTRTIPLGFSYPEACRVRITLEGHSYAPGDFAAAGLLHETAVRVGEAQVGSIEVGYVAPLVAGEEAVLLTHEVKLLDTIATRVSQLALSAQRELTLLLDTLRSVDPDMLLRIAEKLRIHLRSRADARSEGYQESELLMGESNTPAAPMAAIDLYALSRQLVRDAVASLPRGEVYDLIGGWVQEQRVFALVKTVDQRTASLEGILDAVRKYADAMGGRPGEGTLTETWLVSELAHRFLTSDERLIHLVLDNLRIADFAQMIERVIGSANSRGNIGGKGAGLFVAQQVLGHAAKFDPLLEGIKTPRTWYLAADQIVDFLHHNNMEDMNAYKYNSTMYLRMTYAGIVQKIKHGKLPPHTMQMLRMVLEELSDTPIIVRSSSLLEDRQSGAFSGKYKSLFLPNQGTREQRLAALTDAILEVYASMYNPDAIQYRKERGLLNFTEQMGVMIQEVVGRRVGDYFMPAFAGVAFSENILRWSPRAKREDGLVRMVMGLGTRAVDRVTGDYPILFSPGNPGLRVNQTPQDVRHYAPKNIDLINLKTGAFETRELLPLLREVGDKMPDLCQYVSVYQADFLENRNAFSLNPKVDDIVVTFDAILQKGEIPKRIQRMLRVLQEKLECPVDIEFAHDGTNLYLLQCRPQSQGGQRSPAPIPQNLGSKDVLFTANRFISDGQLTGITHIVYVDGDAYTALETREDLLLVGEVVGLLNERLPRRQYLLMGPGRWGSRGDIKLGVRVTYSDISSAAALIEIAREKHGYAPELSFGTHFFQDLVEADILYLPLYPDDKDVFFREAFFRRGENLLAEILPQYARFADVVRVIDVPHALHGHTLSLHMNGDLNQAVAFVSGATSEKPRQVTSPAPMRPLADEDHWRWRQYMAEQLALGLDMDAMGVKGVYLFGSTNAGLAGMGSDIDLLFHVDGDDVQRAALETWLDGWSRALARMNFLHTGYDEDHLLDIHIVTDADISRGDSFAIKIGDTVDPAHALRVRA